MRSLMIGAALCLAFSLSSVASVGGPKIPDSIDAGAADKPPSADAASADQREAALESGAVASAKAPDAMPGPPTASEQFEELKNRVTALARQNDLLKEELGVMGNRLAGIEGRLSLLEEDSRYKLAAAGFGLSFAAGSPSAAFKMQGNLKGFSAFYYVCIGGGIAWSMVIYINRVRVSPLGVGLMVYQDSGNAFTSRWLKRSLDMVFPFGVDVRVWRGITVGMQITWFIPNPIDIAIAGKNAGQSSIDNAASPTSVNSAKEASDQALNDSEETVSRALGDALKNPRFEFLAKWSF